MHINVNKDVSRRGFLGAMGMAGVFGMAGMVGASRPGLAVAEALTAEPDLTTPWSGPGSHDGNWNATAPEDVAAGVCTMPLDELNYRRGLYVDSMQDHVCEDGTVIPAVFVKVRALLNTYAYGVGNAVNDHSFDLVMSEMSEDQAQAYLEMPRGRYFSAYEFSSESGRSVEECEQICDYLFNHAWISRIVNDRGTLYGQAAWVEGGAEYHGPDVARGDTDLMVMSAFGSMDDEYKAANFAMCAAPYFKSEPVSVSVVKDGDIDPVDDLFAIVASKDKFSISPCFCRFMASMAAGIEMPGYPDGDFNLSDISGPCGHDLETCLSIGEEAQFWIDHKVGREITKEEALARLQKSVDDGLILERLATNEAETVCSCHGDCCGIIANWRAVGPDAPTFQNFSHYELEVTEETCVHCGACAQRCPMQAIVMDELSGAPVVEGMCLRCGQCAYVCPTQSRWLVRKKKDEVPYQRYYKDLMELNNMRGAERFERGLIH